MKKQILFFLTIFFYSSLLFASNKSLDVFFEESNNSYTFYAKNSSIIPYFVKIDFTSLTNLKSDATIPFSVTIQSKTDKLLLFTLKPINDNSSIGFQYKYTYTMGDPLTAKHDDNYLYLIPYEHGTKHRVDQGYNGKSTHTGNISYSLDFAMDIGTPVVAARDGIVVDTKKDSNRGGPSRMYENDGNFIKIYHSDGSFAIYAHLMKDGVFVNTGDTVKRGDIIGLSGNTGYSSGPHLHFSVSIPTVNGELSIPTKFLNYDGTAITIEEGDFYYSFHEGKQKFEIITDKNITDDKYKNYTSKIPSGSGISFRKEQIDNTTIVFIQNSIDNRVEAEVTLSLNNLSSSQGNTIKITLQPLTEKFLTILRMIDKKNNSAYSINVSYRIQK